MNILGTIQISTR